MWDIGFGILTLSEKRFSTTSDVLKEIEKVKEDVMIWLNSGIDKDLREYFLEKFKVFSQSKKNADSSMLQQERRRLKAYLNLRNSLKRMELSASSQE